MCPSAGGELRKEKPQLKVQIRFPLHSWKPEEATEQATQGEVAKKRILKPRPLFNLMEAALLCHLFESSYCRTFHMLAHKTRE